MADLLQRSLAMKQNAEFTEVG